MRSARAPITEGFSYPYDSAWRQVREPAGDVVQVFSLVAGAALAVATLVLWLVLVPFQPIRIDYATLLVALLIVVVVHELAHAIVFSFGSKRERRVEVQWRKHRPVLRYDGWLTRTHYLCVLLMPFAAISLGAVLACFALGIDSGDLVLLSMVNALFSGADLVAAFLVWEQIPAHAIVRRQGDAVLWKPGVQVASATAR